MTEQLIVWEEGRELGRKFDVDEFRENIDGLEIRLTNVDTEEKIILSYDYNNCIVCGYKSIDESYWLDKLNTYIKKYDKSFITQHTFFEVLSSSFVEKIVNGSCNMLQSSQLFHLKIVAADSILDIVSAGKPIIRKI